MLKVDRTDMNRKLSEKIKGKGRSSFNVLNQ